MNKGLRLSGILLVRSLIASSVLLCFVTCLTAADESPSPKTKADTTAAESSSESNAAKTQSGKTESKVNKGNAGGDAKDVVQSTDGTLKKTSKRPLINLNTATEAQLVTLPGITRNHAKRIVAGRPYESVDDLSKAGIPALTINRIRTRVTTTETAIEHTAEKPLSDDSALIDLNTATEAQLQNVPEIGEAFAKKVIAGRPYKSVDELAKTGLSSTAIAKIKPQVTVGDTKPTRSKGLVWVNTQSKIYHREGSQWYGKTRSGKYMPEDEAIKSGYVAAKRQ